MSVKENLNKHLGVDWLEYTSEARQDLQDDFLEMAQIKSDLDHEKFGLGRYPELLATEWHFISRNYSLTLMEFRRMLLDKKEKLRQIEYYKNSYSDKVSSPFKEGSPLVWCDIEIQRLENELCQLEIDIANKGTRCVNYEKYRQFIKEQNGGKLPTNEDVQKQYPEYYKKFFRDNAFWEQLSKSTGVDKGTIELASHLEAKAPMTPEFRVQCFQDLLQSKKDTIGTLAKIAEIMQKGDDDGRLESNNK